MNEEELVYGEWPTLPLSFKEQLKRNVDHNLKVIEALRREVEELQHRLDTANGAYFTYVKDLEFENKKLKELLNVVIQLAHDLPDDLQDQIQGVLK